MRRSGMLVVVASVAFLAGYVSASSRGKAGRCGQDGRTPVDTIKVHVPYADSPDGRSDRVLEVYEVTDESGKVVYNKFENWAPADSKPVWRVEVNGVRYHGTTR